MGYINIFASNDVYVSVKNNQLTVKGENKSQDFPIEDINSIMLEGLQSTITTYTLSQLAERGIIVFVCNNSHLPNGVILPFMNYYQTLSQYQNQANLSKPLQKQLWQTIIKNKITNQNEVLNICGKRDVLKELIASVLSGDSSNNEAKASLIYFKKLFGKNFTRRDDEQPANAFLNYGYSVVRGFVARSIVTHGLMPFLGVFHANMYNAYNLADDLLEVFRPAVDLFVKTNFSENDELNSANKSMLYNLINYDLLVDGQKQTISNCIDILVESYAKSLKENKNLLKQIYISRLEIHKYE